MINSRDKSYDKKKDNKLEESTDDSKILTSFNGACMKC